MSRRSEKNNRSGGARGRTLDLKKAHYSTDLIREYEDPEFAERAAQYEAEKRRQNNPDYYNRDASGSRREPGGYEESYHRAQRRREEADRNLYYDNRRYDDRQYDDRRSRSSRRDAYYDDRNEYENSHVSASRSRKAAKEQWYREAEPELERARREKARKKKYRFRPGKLVRNLFILLLVLVLLVGGIGFGIFSALTSNLNTTTLDTSQLGISKEAFASLNDYENILILGSDARAGEPYEGSRTDAIMILSINKKTGKAKMISVMRDSYLKFDGSSGKTVYEKVTHAFAYGGAENTIGALNRGLDLNISQYVLFNWKAVADAVDSLGGVEIDVQENEVSDMNEHGPSTAANVGGTYTPIQGPGKILMDGVQATTYCRIRKTSGGDTARGNRTKIVVEAVLAKARKNPTKMKALMDTVLPQIQTNYSRMDLLRLAWIARKLDITENLSWPKKYYGGYVGSAWVAVPTTLESNVVWLHKEAFGDSDYLPSDTCMEINEEILEKSGHSIPNFTQ